MNPIVYAIPVFMVTILVEAWIAHRRGLAVYDIPDALTSLHLGVVSQVTGLLSKLAGVGLYVLIYENFRLIDLSADSLLVFVLALVVYDFCYYWQHRLGHEVNVLWASHVVHHSSEYFNLSTALRQSSTGQLFGWIFYVPMALAGVPPIVFVAVAAIDLLYQYWVHTELIGRLGWLDRVFVTPSNHRVHHGQNDYCIDKNYGGILIIWDRLFNSFADERADEKIVYGIRSPLRSLSPVWGNLHYYVQLFRESLNAKGWLAKIGLWVAPPGGWPKGPLPHFETSTFSYYDCRTPITLRWYAGVQYSLIIPCVLHTLALGESLPIIQTATYAMGIVVTTICLGFILEGRRHARSLEILRLCVAGGAFGWSDRWFGIETPIELRVGVALFALGSVVWLARQNPWEPNKGEQPLVG
jgi:alkylglycerol monooxygenase